MKNVTVVQCLVFVFGVEHHWSSHIIQKWTSGEINCTVGGLLYHKLSVLIPEGLVSLVVRGYHSPLIKTSVLVPKGKCSPISVCQYYSQRVSSAL